MGKCIFLFRCAIFSNTFPFPSFHKILRTGLPHAYIDKLIKNKKSFISKDKNKGDAQCILSTHWQEAISVIMRALSQNECASLLNEVSL